MKVVKSVVITDVRTLHQKSEKVDMNNSKLVNSLKNKLLDAFNKLEGKVKGLSAIQLDEPYCAILLRYVKGGEPVVVFNPEVITKVGSRKSHEGCESEPNKKFYVKRPILAKVSYVMEDGTERCEWLTYKKARLFCHETDHCNGILLQDIGKEDKAWLLQSSLQKRNSSQAKR